MYQHIVYNEFLPVLLGNDIAKSYDLLPLENDFFHGYDARVYPGLFNELTTAACRFGHVRVRSEFGKDMFDERKVNDRLKIEHFIFNTSAIALSRNASIEHFLRGSLLESAQPFCPHLNKYLNNHLFENINDLTSFVNKRESLSALDIARGRDHGIPGYDHYRVLCGMKKAKDFEGLKNEIDTSKIDLLKSVYAHVDDVDLFTGGTSETPVNGGLVGPTFACKWIF